MGRVRAAAVLPDAEELRRAIGVNVGARNDGAFAAVRTFPGGKTTVTMRITFDSAAQRDSAVKEFHADDGLRQNLEKLAEHVAAR